MKLTKAEFDYLTRLVHQDQGSDSPQLSAEFADEWFSFCQQCRQGYGATLWFDVEPINPPAEAAPADPSDVPF